MKSFKTLIAAAVLGLAILPAISFAQPPAGGGQGGGRRGQTPEVQMTALEEAVGKLSADQKTKIMAIYTKSAADMQAMAQEDRRGPKAQEMRMATQKEIRALLTPEQATKFDAMPPPGRGGRGGQGGQGGAPKKE
ncbi:MAG: hypothetical protein ABIZ81_12720 [Opitutaceae bacterium]